MAEAAHAASGKGPRGGTTTVTGRGWVKKNLWLPSEMAEELREKAFRHRLAEAEIVRRALLAYPPTLSLTIATLGAEICA